MSKRKSVERSAFGNEIRLVDLSRELGVSLTTISRALRGKQGMSEETRERIKKAAAKRGYVSNKAGASLSTGRLFTIGYVIPTASRGAHSQLQADVIRGMLVELTRHGYSLNVYAEEYFKVEAGGSIFDAARRLRVDGLAMTIEHNDPLTTPREPLPFPLVVVNRRVEGLNANFVLADEERGGSLAVAHLIANGRKRIAYIGGPRGHAALERRHEGYRRALAAAGIPYDPALVIQSPSIDWQAGYAGCEALLEGPGRDATAIFCGSDILGFGIIKCLTERGIKVPTDVAVGSFDDSMFAEMTDPALTSVRKQRQVMGQEAARILMGQLKGEVVPSEVLLPVALIVRGSTVPAASPQLTRPSA